MELNLAGLAGHGLQFSALTALAGVFTVILQSDGKPPINGNGTRTFTVPKIGEHHDTLNDDTLHESVFRPDSNRKHNFSR